MLKECPIGISITHPCQVKGRIYSIAILRGQIRDCLCSYSSWNAFCLSILYLQLFTHPLKNIHSEVWILLFTKDDFYAYLFCLFVLLRECKYILFNYDLKHVLYLCCTVKPLSQTSWLTSSDEFNRRHVLYVSVTSQESLIAWLLLCCSSPCICSMFCIVCSCFVIWYQCPRYM